MDHDLPASRLVGTVDERDHVQGPASAVVTLVEYGDYQCQRTRSAHPVVTRLRHLSGDWLRFVFRHFPRTDAHEFAEIAAEAAEAAGAQNMFWEMHNYLMSRRELDEGSLMDYAEEIGLDLDRFEADLEKGIYKRRIKEDIASGNASGVHRTPAFFMNGIKFDGALTEEGMLEALEYAAENVED
ncbi:MAG: thioredoxin domain-containing protein [Armatimonadota bacterium]|nr:thioredoxin domain-containing protein [bacterium]